MLFTAIYAGVIVAPAVFVPVPGFPVIPFNQAQNRYAMPFAGQITRLAWSTDAADATTQISILINGGFYQNCFLGPGPTGSLILPAPGPAPVAAGDDVAIFFQGGTVPGNSILTLSVEPV